MLVSLLTIFLAILGLVQSATVDRSNTCYDPHRQMYTYFSTRTAYARVHGNVSRTAENSCNPAQIWMLARHGTRYPGKSVIPKLLNLSKTRDQIVKNHEKGAGRLCEKYLQKLKNWKLDSSVNEQMADLLAPQGRNDLRFLAERLKRAFPDLLKVDKTNIRPEDFVFRSTNTQRTQESLKSFATGLFGNSKEAKIIDPPVNDTLLLPYENCPAWENSYDPIIINAERDKFTAGPEFRTMLQRVSQRLGYDKPFTVDTLRPIYEMCRFESAWYVNRTSVWCSVFNKEDLQILEYREDLNYYYCCGPGRKLSSKMGCPLLSDMFEHFKQSASGSTTEPKGIFYFAHTITLQAFMSALKIGYEKVPPLASSYATSANRKYRTSILGPFATNVVAIFYKCNNGSNKVTFHVAEQMTPIASCSEDGICDWKSLERAFEDQVNDCDMGFCSKNWEVEDKITTKLVPNDDEMIKVHSGSDRSSEKIWMLAIVAAFVLVDIFGM